MTASTSFAKALATSGASRTRFVPARYRSACFPLTPSFSSSCKSYSGRNSSSISLFYASLSARVSSRALMIRIRSPRSVWATITRRTLTGSRLALQQCVSARPGPPASLGSLTLSVSGVSTRPYEEWSATSLVVCSTLFVRYPSCSPLLTIGVLVNSSEDLDQISRDYVGHIDTIDFPNPAVHVG